MQLPFAEMTAHDAARELLSLKLADVWKYLRLTARSDGLSAKNVHQLRVTSRRATAALDFFAPFVSPKTLKSMRTMVRDTRRVVDAMRDMDVLVEKLQRMASVADRQIWLGALQAERGFAASRIDKLHQRLVHEDRFHRQANSLINGIHGGRRKQFETWAHARSRYLIADLMVLFPGRSAGSNSLHCFRIAVKKARYSLELAGFAGHNRDQASLSRVLTRIQTRLGIMNDRYVAIQDLKRRCASKDGGPWQRLLAREKALAARAKKGVNTWLSTVRPALEHLVDRI